MKFTYSCMFLKKINLNKKFAYTAGHGWVDRAAAECWVSLEESAWNFWKDKHLCQAFVQSSKFIFQLSGSKSGFIVTLTSLTDLSSEQRTADLHC